MHDELGGQVAQRDDAPRSGRAKRGRPASNPARWKRTYREMLFRAGDDRAAIVAANKWAREHNVELTPLALLAERAFEEEAARTSSNAPSEGAAPSNAPSEGTTPAEGTAPSDGAAKTEYVTPADPSAFPDMAASGAAPEAKAEPVGPRFMGESPDLVEGCARGPLFVLGALAEITRGGLVDLTRPVERTLFAGTPVERKVQADPVTRLSELAGVALARRVEASAKVMGGEGGGKPSVTWELVPLALAFAGAVAVPGAGLLSGAARAVGGWFKQGAIGAAGGVSRMFARRGAG